MNLARALLQDQRPADALEQLHAAAQFSPESADVQELMAQAYKLLGKDELARKASARAALLRKKKAP